MSRINPLPTLALAGVTVAVSSVLAYAARPVASTGMEHTRTAGTLSAARQLAATASITPRASDSAGVTAAAALAVADAGADLLFVEPRVPKAAGTPCVETLVTDLPFVETLSSFQFTWTPTGTCKGPWSKIVLVVETTGRRDISAAAMRIHFNTSETGDSSPGPQPGGGVLFMGAPQQTDAVGTWRLERDVTEYADALNRGMQIGYGTAYRDNFYNDFDNLAVTARSVKLLYYPASSATPAQRTADAMRSLDTSEFTANASWTFTDLPRNIERAYLDVMARTLDPGRVWYSCVPTEALATWPQLSSRFGMGDFRPFIAGAPLGCGADNGSYREVEVYVDNQRAGLAPMFPALPSVIGASGVDDPAPSVQALNIVPFRVDLTPFAALLDNGQPHTIRAQAVNSASGAVVTGQLLLYLDKGRSVVTGALTRNTLAAQPGMATVSHTLVRSGDTLQGDINTFLRREYNIEGYVDTSHGRIRSTVYQVSRFANVQHLRVVGPDQTTLPRGENYLQDYTQTVRLSNTVDRVSRRIRGTTLLSEDKDYTTWPISIDYSNGGEVRWSDEGLPFPSPNHTELRVHQARGQRGTHYRLGSSGRYDSALADVFDATHNWRDATTTTPAADYNWSSTRRYLFTDNRGSCYSAGLTTTSGVLQTRTRGTECPNGSNGIRWFAHPDGAPEALLWTVNP